jgi:ammonium transporter, Amt family
LIGAIMVGPRIGRFGPDGKVKPMPGHSVPFVVLGTMILWVGWYGFNPGSTLCISGNCGRLAAKVASTTTISAASGAVSMVAYQALTRQAYDVGQVCNGVLAGLVGVTAACAVVDMWAAFLIGIASSAVYLLGSKALLYFQIDDPVDAAPIHGGVGIWACLAVGIFGNDQNAAYAGYYGSANGGHPFRDGEQFVVQIIGVLAITGFTLFFAILMFVVIKYTIGLRVSAELEAEGLDKSEHGGNAYDVVGELEMTKVDKVGVEAAV